MGETAEVLAEQYKITREEQDEFALLSQTRAARAIASGRFEAEIVPVTIEGKKGAATFARDEHPFPEAEFGKAGETCARIFGNWNRYCGKFFRHHGWRSGGCLWPANIL